MPPEARSTLGQQCLSALGQKRSQSLRWWPRFHYSSPGQMQGLLTAHHMQGSTAEPALQGHPVPEPERPLRGQEARLSRVSDSVLRLRCREQGRIHRGLHTKPTGSVQGHSGREEPGQGGQGSDVLLCSLTATRCGEPCRPQAPRGSSLHWGRGQATSPQPEVDSPASLRDRSES